MGDVLRSSPGITHDRRNGDVGTASQFDGLSLNLGPRESPAQAAQVIRWRAPRTPECWGQSPDCVESSPITWRGSGESRLAPLRVHRPTRGVQRASSGDHSPDRPSIHAPSPDQTCTPTGSISSSYRVQPSGASGVAPVVLPPRSSTVVPAPLTIAGRPLTRSLCTSARLSGIAGPRYS